jgi:hypothetical protein
MISGLMPTEEALWGCPLPTLKSTYSEKPSSADDEFSKDGFLHGMCTSGRPTVYSSTDVWPDGSFWSVSFGSLVKSIGWVDFPLNLASANFPSFLMGGPSTSQHWYLC